uniref:Uncharacterized protein n=1 Tax=Arundo donax TaxID=35708 RepID=A0A0A9B7H4_ARUDO
MTKVSVPKIDMKVFLQRNSMTCDWLG